MYAPDLPVSVAFGGLIALSNLPRQALPGESADALWRRVRLQILAYGLLFHCPDSFFAFIWYPDWNLGYLVPWSSVGYGGALILELGLLSLLLFGGWATLRLPPKLRWLPLVLGFAGLAAALAAVWGPYNAVGTYAEYHAGTARAMLDDAVFQMFTTLAGAYLVVPLVALVASNLLAGWRQNGATERISSASAQTSSLHEA